MRAKLKLTLYFGAAVGWDNIRVGSNTIQLWCGCLDFESQRCCMRIFNSNILFDNTCQWAYKNQKNLSSFCSLYLLFNQVKLRSKLMVFSRSNLMDIFVTERKEKKKPVCLPSFYNSPSFWLGLNEGNLTFLQRGYAADSGLHSH